MALSIVQGLRLKNIREEDVQMRCRATSLTVPGCPGVPSALPRRAFSRAPSAWVPIAVIDAPHVVQTVRPLVGSFIERAGERVGKVAQINQPLLQTEHDPQVSDDAETTVMLMPWRITLIDTCPIGFDQHVNATVADGRSDSFRFRILRTDEHGNDRLNILAAISRPLNS